MEKIMVAKVIGYFTEKVTVTRYDWLILNAIMWVVVLDLLLRLFKWFQG